MESTANGDVLVSPDANKAEYRQARRAAAKAAKVAEKGSCSWDCRRKQTGEGSPGNWKTVDGGRLSVV